jgi:protein-S-isoprenylcysteine O-methyltransferase Ste14
MEETIYRIVANVLLIGAYARVAALALAAARTFAGRRQLRQFRFGPVEAIVATEAIGLLAATLFINLRDTAWDAPAPWRVAVASVGAALMMAAFALMAWSFLSWRNIFFGHGVMDGQQLVTSGVYGVVRHPVYLAALLVWLALAVGFASVFAVAGLFIYVPAYVAYIRGEEQMMHEEFGAEYETYCRSVPMLLARLPRHL